MNILQNAGGGGGGHDKLFWAKFSKIRFFGSVGANKISKKLLKTCISSAIFP